MSLFKTNFAIFNFEYAQTGDYTGFSGDNLIKAIYHKAQKGEITVYDPTFLVDLKEIKMPLDSVKKIISQIPVYQISGVIFNENWYSGNKTRAISKEILGIAPMYKKWDKNGESTKILFYVKMN